MLYKPYFDYIVYSHTVTVPQKIYVYTFPYTAKSLFIMYNSFIVKVSIFSTRYNINSAFTYTPIAEIHTI